MYLVRCQWQREVGQMRFWLGYLLGFTAIFKVTYNYLNMVSSNTMQLFEPWIITMADRDTLVFIFLGYLLTICTAPFTNAANTDLIYRATRKIWNVSMCIYMVSETLIYYLSMLLLSFLVVFRRSFVGNVWSSTLYQSSVFNSSSAAEIYHLSIPESFVLEQWRPYSAALHVFLLIVFYSLMMLGILYCINIVTHKLVGSFIALLVHFISYMLCRDAAIMGDWIKFSPLARACLMYHEGDNLYSTYVFYGIIIVLMAVVISKISKYLEL